MSSAPGGQADVIRQKADLPVGMSAVGGGADVACQELSGPFIAISGQNDIMVLGTNSAHAARPFWDGNLRTDAVNAAGVGWWYPEPLKTTLVKNISSLPECQLQ